MTATFATLSEQVVDGIFAFQPAIAQNAGDHRFDGQTGDFSSVAVRERIHTLERQALLLRSSRGLDPEQEADRLTLTAQVDSWLGKLRDRAEQRQNPMFYFGRYGIGDVGRYVRREYAPVAERVESLIAHLNTLTPAVHQIDENLERELPEAQRTVALDEVRRYPSFYRQDIAAQVGDGLSSSQQHRLEQAAERAAEAMEWLAGRLAARSSPVQASFALGEKAFCAQLYDRELVNLTAAELLQVAWRDLRRNADGLSEAAARFGPGKSIADVVDSIEADHPTAQELIPFVAMVLERLRTFIIERDVISVPSEVRIQPLPTPAYRRGGTAMTDSPGPLETIASQSYYYITLPQADWSAAQQSAWLRYLNRATTENVSAHEAYPGHYVHTLHRQVVRSIPRAVFRSQGFGEGWAHYVEEMLQEVGYAPADNPGLHCMQVRDALLRDCRFVAAVSMHCRGMTVDEATRLFMDHAYLPEIAAHREALRGSHDVLYLNYTLGKLQIVKLRDDYRRLKGSEFSLRAFHDAVVDTGAPPVPIVRKLLLGDADDGRPL